MRTIVSVIGKDAVGIISKVSAVCNQCNVNIVDITQSVLQDMFVMVLLTEIGDSNCSFSEFSDNMKALGKEKVVFDKATAHGALAAYISEYQGKNFQPMNVNFGLLPSLEERIKNKKERYEKISQKALAIIKNM